MSLPRLKKKSPFAFASLEEPSDIIYRSATLRTDRKPSVASIRRHSVIAMTSRLGRNGGHGTVRQVKKVAVPTIPDNAFGLPSSDLKMNTTCSDTMSDSRSTASGDRVQRPTLLHLPSTSFSSNHSHYSATLSVCGSDDSADCRSQLECVMRGDDPSAGRILGGNPAASCYGPSLSAFSSTDVHAQTYHRNSTGSNSSHASSGFESMQSGSLRSAAPSNGNTSSSSSFFSSPSSQSYSSNATSEVCPPSRISVHSDGSASSSLIHSTTDLVDENPYSTRISRPSSAFPAESSSVADMVARGVPEAEIIALWLEKMKFSQYLSVFLTQGYDLASIARVTPEDLINLGITDPSHRKLLIANIHTWHIGDCWPSSVRPTDSIREWFTAIGLSEYIALFESQGCLTMRDVENLMWEDFEDIGVKKLGHMKRLTLAIKKLKAKRTENTTTSSSQMMNQYLRTEVPALNSMQRRNPPPPVPKRQGNNHPTNSGRDIHATFGRSSMSMASGETDGQTKRPVIQVPPTHRKVSASELPTETLKKPQQKMLHDFDEPCKPIRLNLYSSEAILSNALNFEDMTISTHVDDYPPPPPAPLACEGSIRRLQSTFPNNGATTYSSDALPFANDNCGTIRSKGDRVGRSQPSTPRKCVQNVFSAAPGPAPDSARDWRMNRQYDQRADHREFDLMIKNLNDELDAITADYPTLRTHDANEASAHAQRYSVMPRKF
uniref:Caskin-1 n=1 Tax=Steinernema glaseri TaxID=37863 RepID=A0A1I7Z5W7_9BILA